MRLLPLGLVSLVSCLASPANVSADHYPVDVLVVPATCPADVDNNDEVDMTDLLELILNWGTCPAVCPADVTADGVVDVSDLVTLILAWGPC